MAEVSGPTAAADHGGSERSALPAKKSHKKKKPPPEEEPAPPPDPLESGPHAADWAKCDLSYKLDRNQRSVKAERLAKMKRGQVIVEKASRQIGKSFEFCVDAVEFCMNNPGAQVKYAAPTAKMVRAIIRPHLRDILADCPVRLRPEERAIDGAWAFKNGAELVVFGCDNEKAADRGRGTRLDRGYL